MKKSLLFFIIILIISLTGVFLFLEKKPRFEGKKEVKEETLKFGVLPIDKALPFYIAEKEGYFEKFSVKVEIISFSSAIERDSAAQTSQIDGQLSDLVAVALSNKTDEKVKAVSIDMRTTPEKSLFAILSAPNSTIRSIEELKGKKIGLSLNTIMEFVMDNLLLTNGLDPKSIKKVEISKIPIRMEMLMRGQVDAAVLAEPFITLAAKQGAHLIIGDKDNPTPATVIVFSTESIKKKRDGIRKFLLAYEEAVKNLNANPSQYEILLIEKGLIPKTVEGIYTISHYPLPEAPSKSEVDKIIEWMISKELIDHRIPYEQMVDTSLISQR